MALGARALVGLCTVAVAVTKTALRMVGASTGTGHSPVDTAKIATQQTW